MQQGVHARINHPFRLKLSTLFMFTLLASLVTYGVIQYREAYNHREDAGSRCISELANVKYQLDNVLEYKKTMDAVINEVQRECLIQEQSVKEFSNSYLVIKHHLDICEMQTEDLEAECKELKAALQKTNAELTACKKAPG